MVESQSSRVAGYVAYLDGLVERGGPRPDEDDELTATIGRIHNEWRCGRLSAADIARLREVLRFTPETMQGFAFLKPNGYAGCFEIIDRVYRHQVNSELAHTNWDRYFHLMPATQAVRNRKDYFKSWLADRSCMARAWRLLNLASGPCRDVSEYFAGATTDLGRVTCVDQDQRAIDYASLLCSSISRRVRFVQANVIRYHADQQYDLIWSAGLFDYLTDTLFVRLLRQFRGWMVPGGEVVIGNFADGNPTRPFMEVVLDWQLHHRSAEALRELARQADFTESRIVVKAEPLGINLFLHLRV